MPSFLHASSERCFDFMARPDTFNLELPNGDIFYFSIPLDKKALRRMRPQELSVLNDYLSFIRDEVSDRIGQDGVSKLSHAQYIISRWLTNGLSLEPVELVAWNNGHGFPVFGDTGKLVDFVFDRNTIRFEGGNDLIERYETEMEVQENRNESSGANRHYLEEFNQDEMSVVHWERNGQEVVEWQRNGETVGLCLYGGYFQDIAECENYLSTLRNRELDLLDDGLLLIHNLLNGGWMLKPSAGRRRGHDYFKDQDSTKHRNLGAFSPPVYEDRPHQEQGDIRLAPSNAYPCQNSCCCTPPIIDTPRKHTATPSDTPTAGPRNSKADANSQATDIDEPITVYGAAFRSLDDWMQFSTLFRESELDLLSCGGLWLEGSSDTGVNIILGPNAQLQPSPVAQAEVKAISRDQPSTELEAMLSMIRGMAYSQGADFTDASELGASHGSVEAHPAPQVVFVRPTRRVIPVHPVPQVIYIRRAHSPSYSRRPDSYKLQWLLTQDDEQGKNTFQRYPPRTLAEDTLAPPLTIVRVPDHQVTYFAQDCSHGKIQSAHLQPGKAKPLPRQIRTERTKVSQARPANEQHDASSKPESSSQNTRRQAPQDQVFQLSAQAGQEYIERQRPLRVELDRLLAMQRNRKQAARSLEDVHEQAPISSVGCLQTSTPPAPILSRAGGPRVPTRLPSELLRTSKRLKASQRASGAATDHNPNDRVVPESKAPPYQAYAEDSPEDSPRPAFNSWRDV